MTKTLILERDTANDIIVTSSEPAEPVEYTYTFPTGKPLHVEVSENGYNTLSTNVTLTTDRTVVADLPNGTITGGDESNTHWYCWKEHVIEPMRTYPIYGYTLSETPAVGDTIWLDVDDTETITIYNDDYIFTSVTFTGANTMVRYSENDCIGDENRIFETAGIPGPVTPIK